MVQAGAWLELLTLVLAGLPLPTAGLALVSDCVQLLFYHSPWGPNEGASGESEPPAVRVCVPRARPIVVPHCKQTTWAQPGAEHCYAPAGVGTAAQHASQLMLSITAGLTPACAVWQESMQAVVGALGQGQVQRLWVHLLALEEGSSGEEDLAWLGLLACW